jgi:hypothetical protein
MAQQHATDNIGAHFNLTSVQIAEVVAAHMARQRHVEVIAIINAADQE